MQDTTQPILSYSFTIEEFLNEKGDEATSQQTFSADNQARLEELASLLSKDISILVQDADQIRDLLDLIDQDIPADSRTVLSSAAQLDDFFASVRRANKNIASRSSLQNSRESKKKEIKDLRTHLQTAKNSLSMLEPELQAMEEEKLKLENQLAELNVKIQSHKAQLSNLPPSIETTTSRISSAIKEDLQLKAKLLKIQSSEEEDRKVLDDADQIRAKAMDVVSRLLNK